jgi:uncharacterized membrane protein
MEIFEFIGVYLLTIIVFLLLDMVWLLKIAPKFYRTYIGHLMADKPNLIAALFFYLIFIFGLVYFVYWPLRESNDLVMLALNGALFGLVTYATFDLTNMAVLKNFPLNVVVIDLAWGSLISMMVTIVVAIIL